MSEAPPRPGLHPLLALAIAAAVFCLASCGEEAPTGPPPPPPPPANTAPVASAGADAPASIGLTVTLDGSASTDADGDALTYSWTLTGSPAGSAAALTDATTATPSFVPDVAGAYTLSLVVNDGTDDSPADAATITAADNTMTALIGATGGSITSSDGVTELTVPAGALAADTEISVTLVEASQLPPELESLGSTMTVLDLKPDGLQFSVPATLTTTQAGAVDQAGDTARVDVPFPFTIYDGPNGLTADTVSGVTIEASNASGDVVLTSGISHFSNHVTVQGWITVETTVPQSVEVGTVFEVPVTVQVTPSDASLNGSPTQTDDSGPLVAPDGIFDPDFSANRSANNYVCDSDGMGWYRTHVDLDYNIEWDGFNQAIASIWVPNAAYKSRATLIDDVECTPPPAPPPGSFTDVTALQAEKIAALHTSAGMTVYGLTHGDGITVVDDDGAVLREVLPGAALGGLYGAAGHLDPYGVGNFLAYGAEGIYGIEYGAVEALVKLLISVSNVTDNTGNTTDAVHFKWAPSFHTDGPSTTSHTTVDRFAFAQHADRNVLFVDMDANGNVTVVPELENAFVDTNGVSVFGTDRPLALWIGPNGFDENNPMLVLTIDDSTFGDLNIIELVNGQAVRTIVQDFTSIIEPRELVCDDATGICGISSFRTHSFGGIYTFKWDGQTNVSLLTPRLSFAPVGIDIINTGTSVLMTGTDTERFVNGAFQFEYRVIEFDLNGAQLRSAAFLVPQGCADPFHAAFRRRVPTFDQVLIGCYGDGSNDGRVTASTFTWPTPR